ncbi:MAG TPA: SDR family NAD(P)-dependent oxidoreductase, partial [Skermanella sp.]|nr:SDR family NAD(P)-dependent oxidoreductase [Skermanella sp.]
MSFADRFSSRRAVITGGASGIGLGVATRLAAEGASVCLWDLDQDALNAATEALGPKSIGVKVNIAEWGEVERAANEAVEQLGGIDVLVASA